MRSMKQEMSSSSFDANFPLFNFALKRFHHFWSLGGGAMQLKPISLQILHP